MARPRKASADDQFDLFLPYIADLNFRDQREMMERPFFSLAKNKRVKPIDYTSPDGKLWVHVSANPDYGMATIWDADILIYCASVLADMARRGVNDIPRKLHIMPFDLLRSIGRPTTGRAYELLGQAMDRLVSTTIKTNIRAENRREATFSWLDGWSQLVDERTERSKGMTIELSNWFYEGVIMKGGVLSIYRSYFNITGGRERWLYRVARKHASGMGESGFAISMPTLFEKSGAEGEYRRFKFEILKLAEKNALPGYALSVEAARSDSEPLLRMRRILPEEIAAGEHPPEDVREAQQMPPSPSVAVSPKRPSQSSAAKDARIQRSGKVASEGTGPHLAEQSDQLVDIIDAKKFLRGAIAGLSEAATRGYMADETIDLLRNECPGWDLYALHADFEAWVAASPERTPANWQKAFIGWVRRHHQKHRHSLRG
jgi:plasmid replication initiation protein